MSILMTDLSWQVKAQEKTEEFTKSYALMINKFTKEFANGFCKDTGEIDWDKLVRYNSGQDKMKI